MTLTILLLSLLVLLVGFLVWRRVPRQQLFEIVHVSAWIYALSFFLSLQILGRIAPQMEDGFVPYILAGLPVALFVAWALNRRKHVQK
jgi:hypothetical protein